MAAAAPVNVSCVEPLIGHWTNSAKFGQRFQGPMPATEGASVNLIANDNLPGPPAPWTINLFRSNRNVLNESSPFENAEFRARITYGAGGASNTFDCDLISGVQFELVCNTIRIDLVSYAPNSLNPYTPGVGGMICGALIGKGSAASQGLPPTYTTQFSDASPMIEIIPDFARRVVVVSSEDDPAAFGATDVLQLEGGGAALSVFNLNQYYDQLRQGVWIPAGASNAVLDISIAHRSALQFLLAL